MHFTSTSLSFFIWPASYQMRLCNFASTLVPVLVFTAKADASANATTSPTLSGTTSSTGDRSGTLISKLPNARDEERVGGIKDLGWEDVVTEILTKYPTALHEQEFTSLTELKDTWWRADRADPHFVYAKLELDKLDESILSDFRFHAWVKHVHNYNLAHPKDQVSIFRQLLEQYGDYELSMMLEEATKEDSPLLRAIGTKLQSELISYWKNENVSPKQLYKMLQPDKLKPSLLSDRKSEIWKLYYSKVMPGESMEEFDQLFKTFSEKELASLLISATRSKSLRAREMLYRLANVWYNKGMKPEFVFEQLMLDRDPIAFFDHVEVYIWMVYAEVYNNRHTEAVTLNQMLETYYSEYGIEVIIETTTTARGKAYAKALEDEREKKLLLSTIESKNERKEKLPHPAIESENERKEKVPHPATVSESLHS